MESTNPAATATSGICIAITAPESAHIIVDIQHRPAPDGFSSTSKTAEDDARKIHRSGPKPVHKRKADEVDLDTASSPQMKRRFIHYVPGHKNASPPPQTPKAAIKSSSKVTVYAVVACRISKYLPDSMSEWDRGLMDVEEGQDIDEEVLGLYTCLEDANNRVRREWEESDAKVMDEQSFQGRLHSWSVDATDEEEGIRVLAKEMLVNGEGSESAENGLSLWRESMVMRSIVMINRRQILSRIDRRIPVERIWSFCTLAM